MFFTLSACHSARQAIDENSAAVSQPSTAAPEIASSPVSRGGSVTHDATVPADTPRAIPARTSAAPAATPTAPTFPALAHLKRFQRKVDLRRREELVWRGAQSGQPLEKHDALQTHDKASAGILFRSGSQLDVAENTLLVLDRDPNASASAKPREDRVILRDGSLVGSTPAELWMLTSAGLVQLRADSDGKPARVALAVKEGEKLVVRVESGHGSVINPNREINGAPERIELAPRLEIKLPAPHPKWAETGKVTPESWTQVDRIARAPARLTPAQLTLESPAEGLSTADSSVGLAGRISGSGARVLVNGIEAELDSALAFMAQVDLDPGANVIVIQLIRPDGTVDFQRRTVVRKER